MLQPNNQLHQSPTRHYSTHPDHHMQPPAPFTPISHRLCMKLIHVPTEHTSILQNNFKNVKRCRDGNVCEAYVILFLFGSFFTVCHPYIDIHFLKCFSVTCMDSVCYSQVRFSFYSLTTTPAAASNSMYNSKSVYEVFWGVVLQQLFLLV